MYQTRTHAQQSSLVSLSGILLFLGMLVAVLTGCSSQPVGAKVLPSQPERHVQAKLDIIVNQPGYQQDWPAFSPDNLVVPANSLVTITLHDYDLGLDSTLSKGTPFATVQGTVGGTASLNGKPYASLVPERIAHTFTIPQLHINVPLPGDGKESDTITFTLRTGKAGTYTFQCFDPCGTGQSGFEGPMATKGYMIGTLTVQ